MSPRSRSWRSPTNGDVDVLTASDAGWSIRLPTSSLQQSWPSPWHFQSSTICRLHALDLAVSTPLPIRLFSRVEQSPPWALEGGVASTANTRPSSLAAPNHPAASRARPRPLRLARLLIRFPQGRCTLIWRLIRSPHSVKLAWAGLCPTAAISPVSFPFLAH